MSELSKQFPIGLDVNWVSAKQAPKVKILNQHNNKEFNYRLVAEEEADLAAKKISVTSPLGKGLLGKKVGDDQSHLKLSILEGANQKTYNAIGFGMGNKCDLIQNGKSFKAVFNIDENHWNGYTSLQLMIKDLKEE